MLSQEFHGYKPHPPFRFGYYADREGQGGGRRLFVLCTPQIPICLVTGGLLMTTIGGYIIPIICIVRNFFVAFTERTEEEEGG